MKKVQKVLALLLVFMMVFTTAGMNVAAAGEMDSVAGEADIQSQEQQQTSEGILEYVYVDEAVVNMPQTQNIAVGFRMRAWCWNLQFYIIVLLLQVNSLKCRRQQL